MLEKKFRVVGNLNNTSIYIIWKKIGFGQSNLKYKQITTNNALYDLYNSSLDISYTFGSNWTFTIGKGVVYKGMGSIRFFDNNSVFSINFFCWNIGDFSRIFD